jgi:hypothetical protein
VVVVVFVDAIISVAVVVVIGEGTAVVTALVTDGDVAVLQPDKTIVITIAAVKINPCFFISDTSKYLFPVTLAAYRRTILNPTSAY